MEKLSRFMLWIAGAVVIQACEKNGPGNNSTAAEILTAKPWKLISYGFDSNNNGMVDPNEEAIRDCEKDNTYTFNIDGSGVVSENSMICNGNSPTNHFTWALTRNDTVLDFLFANAAIVKLSADSLHIADLSSSQEKLLLVYAH